jgi:hypothetical protein
MAKATIMGEYHTSLKDAEELKIMVESGNYDAIFLENREEKIFDENIKSWFTYFFYLFGYVEFRFISQIQTSRKPMKVSAEKLGIPVINVDAPIPIIFTVPNIWIKRILPPLFILLFGFATLFLSSWSNRLEGLAVFSISPLFYFAILVALANSKRNDIMANSITNEIKDNNYKNVIVSCGKAHVKGITKNLKLADIDVRITS